jgi:hypothetical protein
MPMKGIISFSGLYEEVKKTLQSVDLPVQKLAKLVKSAGPNMV